MFDKGSRYQKLNESSPVDAGGERLRGKVMRYIPDTEGNFLHTVRDGDRLDLLAYKYYGDAARWWQISDANPEFSYPTDLLDRAPLAGRRFWLAYSTFETRLALLRDRLRASAQIVSLEMMETQADESDFLRSVIVVEYRSSPETRRSILQTLAGADVDFHFLDSRRWQASDAPDANIFEAFSFDDVTAKTAWQEMIDELATLEGVRGVRSRVVEAALDVFYLGTQASDSGIIAFIKSKGFDLQDDAPLVSRTGARIVVPPNRAL